MINAIPSYFSDMPLYRKAQDIIVLSQNISIYLNQDLNYINNDGSEDPHIYFSGDIVQQSYSLAPEIINAEREKFSKKKYKHIERIDRLTSLLYKNCKRLEKANSNGKDYLSILRTELKTFRLLKNNWILTL